MYEPVSTDHFLIAFSAGAIVLISGAGYAMAFALSRLQKKPQLMILAWISYALLAASVFALTQVMNFSGYWLTLSATMLIGYLLAPHAIWHLSVRTHEAAHEDEPTSESLTTPDPNTPTQ